MYLGWRSGQEEEVGMIDYEVDAIFWKKFRGCITGAIAASIYGWGITSFKDIHIAICTTSPNSALNTRE